MAKLTLAKASTDVTVYVFVQNNSVTTGAGLTGLVHNTASLTCYYVRPGAAAAALSLATQTTTGSHSDGGFVEVDATNMPGVYRLDLPDAVCATGVNSVVVMLKGATNMAPCLLEIQLSDFNLNNSAPNVTVTTNSDKTGYSISGTLTTLDALDTAQDTQHSTTQSAIAALNDVSSSDVQTAAAAALTAYDPPTKAELDTAIDALPTAAENRAEMDSNSTQLAAIVADTNELQTDWTDGGRLDLILDARASQTSVDTIDGIVDSILVDTGTDIPASIAALNNLSAAQVNAQVLDVLNVDVFSELTGVPADDTTLSSMIRWLYIQARNKITQTATTQTIYADDGSTSVATSTVSDDGTTATRGKFA